MDNDGLLMQIMMLDFAVQDASLFLDTHPCDREALAYFNEATTRLDRARQEFSNQGRVLNNREIGAYQNDYITAPWPWVGGKSCGCTKRDCNIQ